MSQSVYRYPVGKTKGGRKKGRAGKIALGIVAGVVLLLIILVALEFNNILMLFGKGHLKVKTVPQIQQSMQATDMFESVTQSASPAGDTVLQGVSKDGAVDLTVTQQKDGGKTVSAQIDLNKIDTSGLDVEGLKRGSPSAIQDAKKQADKYIGTMVDAGSLTGMEGYLATALLSQARSNPDQIDINHAFGSTTLKVTGSLNDGVLSVELTQ